MFGIQFYPTPQDLVEYMLDKVDWDDVKFVLEPSAGKGDILERAVLGSKFLSYQRRRRSHRSFTPVYRKAG